nr:helix-turn-helix transcriptional regulator [Brevibacillus laterosporus]
MSSPFKYIVEQFDMQFKDIAAELGISKPQISSWINGSRKIPSKHIDKLSEMFNLPKSYFAKEKLNRVEELEVQIAYFHKKNSEEAEEIEDTLPDGSVGSFTYYPYYSEVSFLEDEKEKEILFLKMEALLNNDQLEIDTIFNRIVRVSGNEKKIRTLHAFVYLLEEPEIWGVIRNGFFDFEGELYKDLSEVLKKHKIIKGKNSKE